MSNNKMPAVEGYLPHGRKRVMFFEAVSDRKGLSGMAFETVRLAIHNIDPTILSEIDPLVQAQLEGLSVEHQPEAVQSPALQTAGSAAVEAVVTPPYSVDSAPETDQTLHLSSAAAVQTTHTVSQPATPNYVGMPVEVRAAAPTILEAKEADPNDYLGTLEAAEAPALTEETARNQVAEALRRA